MMPQPSWMRRVCAAMTARIAVEERASTPCLRHQGYASAIQNASKPSSSQAFAIAAVSCTGSILSCNTPMLNGTVIRARCTPLVRVLPGMFETLDQSPQRLVEGSGHSDFVAPLCDGAIHKINFRLALGENVLEHAGAMFSGRVRAFLDELPGIAVQFDAEPASHGFAFGNQVIKELAGRAESRGCAVMQQRQGPNRICGCVENKFGPLCATGILERNRIHPRAGEKASEFFDARHRRIAGLERTNPSISFDVIADVTGSDRMSCRKCCSTNDVFHMLGDNFFIADAILYRAHCASFIEDMRHLGDRHLCVNRFGGDNTVVASWQLLWIDSRI